AGRAGGPASAAKVRSQSGLAGKSTRRKRAWGWSWGLAPTNRASGADGRAAAEGASSESAEGSTKATPRSTPSRKRSSGERAGRISAPLPARVATQAEASPPSPRIATRRRSGFGGGDIRAEFSLLECY